MDTGQPPPLSLRRMVPLLYQEMRWERGKESGWSVCTKTLCLILPDLQGGAASGLVLLTCGQPCSLLSAESGSVW